MWVAPCQVRAVEVLVRVVVVLVRVVAVVRVRVLAAKTVNFQRPG